ncbi:hypothetical protein [Streptococcus sobrinus]|uniref:hypothetical protein n=1 Tax=Streptococcus sobrinus TaxID=1310 RepID=UPI0018A96CAA|nr:hypothetical protein [Streptococcus sobrinus]
MNYWNNLKNSVTLESGYDELQKQIYNEYDGKAYRLCKLISALPNLLFFILLFKWPSVSAIGFLATYMVQSFFQLRLERQKVKKLRRFQMDKLYVADDVYQSTLKQLKLGAIVFGASISAIFTPFMILAYSLLRNQSFLSSLLFFLFFASLTGFPCYSLMKKNIRVETPENDEESDQKFQEPSKSSRIMESVKLLPVIYLVMLFIALFLTKNPEQAFHHPLKFLMDNFVISIIATIVLCFLNGDAISIRKK